MWGSSIVVHSFNAVIYVYDVFLEWQWDMAYHIVLDQQRELEVNVV